MGYTNVISKFPLFSKHYFHTNGKDFEFTVIGHHVSQSTRQENVIALFKTPVPDHEIESGEAIVLDTLYISGPVV